LDDYDDQLHAHRDRFPSSDPSPDIGEIFGDTDGLKCAIRIVDRVLDVDAFGPTVTICRIHVDSIPFVRRYVFFLLSASIASGESLRVADTTSVRRP